jgi:hypothetical protein
MNVFCWLQDWINSAVINDYLPGGCIVSHVDPPQGGRRLKEEYAAIALIITCFAICG